MSPPVPAWAGSTGLVLVSTGAGPRQGGRIRKWMARVQQGWQRAQRPLPGGPLPTPAGAVLSSKAAKSPSQERTGWRPSAEREADRGHPVSWPETPLAWHSRHKPLGHLQPCLQTTWLRQADLIPPTREDCRARKTQEQMVSKQHFKNVQQASYRLRLEDTETSAGPAGKLLPPHSQQQRRLRFFYKLETCFRHAFSQQGFTGPFQSSWPLWRRARRRTCRMTNILQGCGPWPFSLATSGAYGTRGGTKPEN